MRRTFPVVPRIVALYDMRMVENLSPNLLKPGNKLRRILHLCSILFGLFHQKTNQSLNFHLYSFQQLLRIKSAYYLSKSISMFFIFDHYKSINKTVMRRTLIIVLTIFTFCTVKAPKLLLTNAGGGKKRINFALKNIRLFTNSFSSDFYLNYSNLNEISVI